MFLKTSNQNNNTHMSPKFIIYQSRQIYLHAKKYLLFYHYTVHRFNAGMGSGAG